MKAASGRRNPKRKTRRKRVFLFGTSQHYRCCGFRIRTLTFEKSRSKRYKACSDVVPVTGLEPVRCRQRWILSYSSHSEPNGLNRNKTVFSVTFQNIKNPKKPYKISIFDAKPQKHKQSTPSSIISSQTPNLRRWRDVGGMYAGYTSCKLVQKPYTLIEIVAASSVVDNT